MSFAAHLATRQETEKLSAEAGQEFEKQAEDQYNAGFNAALEMDKAGQLGLEKAAAAVALVQLCDGMEKQAGAKWDKTISYLKDMVSPKKYMEFLSKIKNLPSEYKRRGKDIATNLNLGTSTEFLPKPKGAITDILKHPGVATTSLGTGALGTAGYYGLRKKKEK